MSDHSERTQRQGSKPQLTDADKALLEAEPDWERMGEAAERLLQGAPKRSGDDGSRSTSKENERA